MKFGSQKSENDTKVIVLRGEELDEKQLTAALQFSERQRTALAQLIEFMRIDLMDAAQTCALANNQLAMSFNNGGHHALTKFLENLEERILPT